jgi:hypothetical protein
MTQPTDGSPKSYESFWFLFLAGIYTLITLVLFLCFWGEKGISKTDDFNFYVLGWAFFVPLGLGMAFLTEKIGSLYIKNFHSFGFIASFLNFLFLLYELCTATWESNPYWVGLVEFLLLQFGIVLIAKAFQLTGRQLSAFLEKSLMVLMSFIFVLWVLCLSPESIGFFKNASIFNWLLGLLFVWIFYRTLSGGARETPTDGHLLFFRKEWFYYLAVLLWIVFLVVSPGFEVNQYHYTFYLGPLADFQAGKSFLVNINSQYGILNFYFLSLFFKVLPLGFKSFSFLLSFLYVAQYFCFYFIARQLFSSRMYAFICLMALLVVSCFAAMGRLSEYPSVGPLRFGFIYVLLALVILRNRNPAYKKYFYIVESGVAALAIFWSFEVCVYTLPAYLGLILYESVDRGKIHFNGRQFFQRLFYLTGFSLFILISLYADVYRRTGDWPHWDRYFDYVFLYKNGFGMLPVPALGGWWIIVGILLISMLVIWGSLTQWKNENLPPHFNAVVLLTFYGIFQLFYFWGRAHVSNLFSVSMPSVLLGFYWLYEFRIKEEKSHIPGTLRTGVILLSGIGLGFYLQLFLPDTASKLTGNLAGVSSLLPSMVSAAKDLPRDDDFVKRASLLMNRYSGSKKQLIYFFGDRGLEVSMYTGRFNAFPYNDIGQVCICPPALQRVVSYDPVISIGDYIYASEDADMAYYDLSDGRAAPSPLEKMLFYKLNREYVLKMIEKQKGIAVYQVTGVKGRYIFNISNPVSAQK